MKNKKLQSRQEMLEKLGFGTEVMKKNTVCSRCRSMQPAVNRFCGVCGYPLSKTTIYDVYRMHHRSCRRCGAVLSDDMNYCTYCGAVIASCAEDTT